MTLVGRKLKRARLARRMTIQQLSDKSKVSDASISYIESGEVKNPTMSTLQKLADALGVSVEYFFSDDVALPRDILDISDEVLAFVTMPETEPYIRAAMAAWRRRVPPEVLTAFATSLGG